MTSSSTGRATESTSRTLLYSRKELVLCLDPHMAENKSCAPTVHDILDIFQRPRMVLYKVEQSFQKFHFFDQCYIQCFLHHPTFPALLMTIAEAGNQMTESDDSFPSLPSHD